MREGASQALSHAKPRTISDCPLDDWLRTIRERLQFTKRSTLPVGWPHNHRNDKDLAFLVLSQGLFHFNAVAIIRGKKIGGHKQ